MELYLINNGIRSPKKLDKTSGLIKIIDGTVNKLTDETSRLIGHTGNCEEVKVYYGASEKEAKQEYKRIVSSTIRKNGLLLALNSAIAIVSYLPPLTFIPFASLPFITLAINNYHAIAGAKKGAAKTRFIKHEELATLEELLKEQTRQEYSFKDSFLQDIYETFIILQA